MNEPFLKSKLKSYLNIFDRRYGKGSVCFKRIMLEYELDKFNDQDKDELLKLFDNKFNINNRISI